ncbi:MAG: hypothetical protein AVDCRST_MAG37-180 [uncultured Rubrobacteraceae bacterium]|uniref:Putative auto-transporter adhesin head GIN domain-containing protein n=1 Tax=uncultured Rubrobacteraceae bacterium TaxID=349277 RepID=A0A6J4PT63_9ACTN|nr:MAG: hypothetical protein AVDCRST_MAG37-180 [uncultured Rubrobacteraceae bacterium]
MRTNTALLLTGVLLSFAFAAGYAGNVAAGVYGEGDQAQLEVTGTSGTEFSGSCTVGEGEPEEINGQVPATFTYDLEGKPLNCEVSSAGDVQVELTVGENVHSVQRFSGGTLNLTYDNGSISSVTSSSGSTTQVSSSSSEVVSSSTGATAQGSSDVTSESRDVSGFDEVELQGIGNLSIQQADSESLTVEAEEGVLPKIRTEVVDNRLILGPDPNTSIQTTQQINYTLTVKDLNALKVSGSGDIEAEGISTDKLTVAISGAGDVKVSGKADSQEVDISGTGAYHAKDLESKDAKIDVAGAGSATVNVSDELNAEVSGSGSVKYIGDPTVNQDVSGVGRVSKY